jgi:hypothetical protein
VPKWKEISLFAFFKSSFFVIDFMWFFGDKVMPVPTADKVVIVRVFLMNFLRFMIDFLSKGLKPITTISVI